MYDIIKIVEGNFYLSFLFLVVALSRRKIAGVMPLIYTGVILLLVSEMIRFGGTRVDIFDIPLFYWLRFFAVIVWGMASLIGVFSRLSEAESGVVADEDVLLPSIPVSENNFVTEAERRRVELVNLIEELAEQRGIKVQVMSSQNYEPNPVIRVEVSNPEKQNGNLVYVSSATIILKSFPFRRFPLLFEVRLYNGIKKKSYTSVTRLASWEINKLLSILVGQMKIKSFRPSKARCWLWQLWLPKNKIAACSTRHPHAVLLFFMSLIFPPFLLFLRKKPKYRIGTGQPSQSPRRLLRMDSWQTRIKDVGFGEGQIREKFEVQARKHLPPEVSVKPEEIRYWAASGKVERNQIVVTLRRAVLFIHIYPYGKDLYIGWDVHVNTCTWREHQVGEGFSFQEKLPVNLYSVKPFQDSPNEYDLFDANFISESVHSILSQLIRGLLKEYRIDQEIDFTIVRESRRPIVESEKNEEKNKAKRFSRTR